MRRRSSFSVNDVRRCVCANIRETSQTLTNVEAMAWQGPFALSKAQNVTQVLFDGASLSTQFFRFKFGLV